MEYTITVEDTVEAGTKEEALSIFNEQLKEGIISATFSCITLTRDADYSAFIHYQSDGLFS